MVKVLFVVHNMREGDIDYSLPLGTAYLAAILEDVDADVRVLDLDTLGMRITDEEFVVAAIKEHDPDFVCIGFAAARFNHIQETLKAIRRGCDETNAVMVLGGHGPSATPVFVHNHTNADVVIVGEADLAILDVVYGNYRGVVIADKVKEIDSIPLPAWHLFDMYRYCNPRTRLYTFDYDEKMAFVISSRGCIGKCSFCYRMRKGYRPRSVDKVREEIQILKDRYGIGFVFFLDEMAFTGTKRTLELCTMLEKLDIRWATANRAETLQDYGRAKMLKEAGCTNVGIGFESMDADVLKRMNKMVTPEQNIIAAENCRKAGLDMSINMLWNMPGDNEETLAKNLQFILDYSTWNECRTIKPVTPYPGSPLFYKAWDEWLIDGPEDFYRRLINLDLITVNFMDIPDSKAYDLLYEGNARLIDEYCINTGHEFYYGDAEEMKQGYYDLYFNADKNFRGVR